MLKIKACEPSAFEMRTYPRSMCLIRSFEAVGIEGRIQLSVSSLIAYLKQNYSNSYEKAKETWHIAPF